MSNTTAAPFSKVLWYRISSGRLFSSSHCLVLCLMTLANKIPISSCSINDPNTPPTTSLDGLDIISLLQMRTCSCVSIHGFSWLQFRGQFSLFLYMLLKLVFTDRTHLERSAVIVCLSLACNFSLLRYGCISSKSYCICLTF